MMQKSFSQVVALAAAVVFGTSSHADTTTNVGVLSSPGSFGFASSNLAPNTLFTDTILFKTVVNGLSLSVDINQTYSDNGDKIQLFWAKLKDPSLNSVTLGNYVDDPDFGSQSFSGQFLNAPAGDYVLTIHGQTAAYSTKYGVSVSAVPEPESVAMMLAGIAVLGIVGARRKLV